MSTHMCPISRRKSISIVIPSSLRGSTVLELAMAASHSAGFLNLFGYLVGVTWTSKQLNALPLFMQDNKIQKDNDKYTSLNRYSNHDLKDEGEHHRQLGHWDRYWHPYHLIILYFQFLFYSFFCSCWDIK